MERFCDKCGSLVSGDGSFCPSCGASMGSVGTQGGVDLSKGGSMPSTSDPFVPTPTPTPIPTQGSSYQQSQSGYTQPNYSQTVYPQTIYPQSAQNQEMSVGQWVLTIFLSGLGIIGIILLFVWGFSADTPIAKKNYARAMLIFQAIALALSFIMIPIFFSIIYGIAEEFGGAYLGLFMNLLGK